MQKEQQIVRTDLSDVAAPLRVEQTVSYNDDELVIIDGLRELADLTARKVTFNIVAACTSGRMTLDVAGVRTTVEAGQIFICQSHAVLSNFMVSPDFECKVMCISDRLQRSILEAQGLLWNKMLYSQRCRILRAKPDRFAIYNELRYYWLNEGSPFKREILVSLLRVAFLELCDMLMQAGAHAARVQEKAGEREPENTSRMETLFHRFLESVARRRIKKLSVSEYADELCITPKYLSTVCRTVSGKSPTEWISEYVIEDITHYLRSTDLTAKEIADELGFPNASFFGKYVREHLGISPNEYRRKQLETNT